MFNTVQKQSQTHVTIVQNAVEKIPALYEFFAWIQLESFLCIESLLTTYKAKVQNIDNRQV